MSHYSVAVKLLKLIACVFLSSVLLALSQGVSPDSSALPGLDSEVKPLEPKPDGVRVTVLGYHDFSETRKVDDMLIRTSKFRRQMQAIKDLKLNVISLEDFMLWKEGKKSLPDKSVLITIDDGWKSVYTDAYPILKEFGFPFAVYLYTDYIEVNGRSMTKAMIREMMENGCSIGSHSVSHPRPSVVKKKQGSGKESYEAFLHKEYGESKKILKQTFSKEIVTYVYPGGHYHEDMFPIIDEHGYEFLFTCVPGKVTRKTPNRKISRYIILGQDRHDSIFKLATSFKATAYSRASAGAIFEKTIHPTSPSSGQRIKNRLPEISADLSKIAELNPDSVEMVIAGFGRVPASFNPESKSISWKMNRKIRFPSCSVTVRWKLNGKKSYEKPMSWTFVIDKQASYLPKPVQE